jgi:hypothetical protein
MCIVLPEFSDLYRQLRAADADYARQCMAQWEAFLRGPPNRPTKDRFKLTEVGMHHIIYMRVYIYGTF